MVLLFLLSQQSFYRTMAKGILPSQFFLPLSAVSLGRFVISFDEPHQDFHDPPSNTKPDAMEKVQTLYDNIHHSANHQEAASQLTMFLSSFFSKRLIASLRVTADQAKTYYLNNAGQWVRDPVRAEDTQKWIERTIDEGEDIYVVVAYQTLLDARISEQLGGHSATGGRLTIPASAALAASGVVVPLTDLVDPGFSGSRSRTEDEQRRFTAPGEQVYAVQYRRIRWGWFAHSKFDKMTLKKKAWWQIYDRPRYLHGEVEDAIEVELEDEVVLDNEHAERALEFADST